MKLREELMALEKGSWGFMRDKNYDGMQGFLGDDALLIFGDGSRYNKRQTLELMKDFSLQSHHHRADLCGAHALARRCHPALSRHLPSAVKGGKPETIKVLSSSVYARRDGKWWSVLYQETPIK